jgi:hypothetical protein
MPKMTNPLGDIKAEADKAMLDTSFYETPDYKALLESPEKALVVGRRGTGKSALFYKLSQDFKTLYDAPVLAYSPEDYEIAGLRSRLKGFQSGYNHTKSAAKLLTKYALTMEVTALRIKHFKFNEIEGAVDFTKKIHDWVKSGDGFFARMGFLLKNCLGDSLNDSTVADLAEKLEIKKVEKFATNFFNFYNYKTVFLLDRLDEGYEHDTLGIAFLAGIAEVITIWNSVYGGKFRGIAFIRDNIARSIENADPDFSRNFESQIIRLHWARQDLFHMACFRIKRAFNINHESNNKIWQSVTASELSSSDGFDLCLRLTLYRPRDLLVLLNEAFNKASRYDRIHIDLSDLSGTAKDISGRRYSDLLKEYSKLIPGLELFTRAFSNASPSYTYQAALSALDSVVLNSESTPVDVVQYCAILNDSSEVLRALYSVGFVGARAIKTNSYSFCHDGKTIDMELHNGTELLIHPCYWMALNISEAFSMEIRSEINDEYDEVKIDVASVTTEQRHHKLGQLITQLSHIKHGADDCDDFEEWCKEAIRIIYAGALANVELHPNKESTLRRDVVARNTGNRSAWKRILDDYSVRQVVFEVKNYSSDLGGDEYRQMASYLHDGYGRLGFIITRSKQMNLSAGKELDWVRQFWNTERKLIIKISADNLAKSLSKLRSPERHDAADSALHGLLDQYERNYLSLPTSRKKH